jgi:iron complex transport system substrate-binding protein
VSAARPARGLAASVCLLLAAQQGPAQTVAATDDRGRPLSLPAPARRIVALAPNLAELAFDAGAGAALVGVVRGSDYPAQVSALPAVGDAAGIDLERVVALRPDLVLAWLSGNRASDLERIERLGVAVFAAEARRLRDVPATLRRIGALAGTAAQAERAALAFERRLAQIASRPSSRRPSVFVQIWDSPLMTVNAQHLISDVLAACGARNAFASLPALAGSVDVEAVLAADPDVILVAAPAARDATAAWRRFPNLRAGRAGRLVQIDPDLITRASPRILEGVERVCAQVTGNR